MTPWTNYRGDNVPNYCICENTTHDGLGECNVCGRVPKAVIDARHARRM